MTQEEALQKLIDLGIIKSAEDLRAVHVKENNKTRKDIPNYSCRLIHDYARLPDGELIVDLMLDVDPSLALVPDSAKRIPSMISLSRGYLESTIRQIERCPEIVLIQDGQERCLAHIAATYGYNNVLEAIGEANRNAFLKRDYMGNTPLYNCQGSNNKEGAKYIIDVCPESLEDTKTMLSFAPNETMKLVSQAKSHAAKTSHSMAKA